MSAALAAKKKGKVNAKSFGGQHLAMNQAIELLVQDDSKNQPNFTRGPEIELTTRQDVEHLKALLAQAKLNIPTNALEKAIVMPSDIASYHPGNIKIKELLMQSSKFHTQQ